MSDLVLYSNKWASHPTLTKQSFYQYNNPAILAVMLQRYSDGTLQFRLM
jgi:hypothetical protein